MKLSPIRSAVSAVLFCFGLHAHAAVIVDDAHVLRRFHSDHMRGEAAFASPGAVDLPRHRFDAMWEESRVTLLSTKTGL